MEVGCSVIFEKTVKREEMDAASNSPICLVIIFSRSAYGDQYQKSGRQEVFVGGSRLRIRKTAASMGVRWSGR